MKCVNCVHYTVCVKCDYDEDRKNCIDFITDIPCKVGQKVYVDSRTLPNDLIDLDEIPKFFEAKVISIRQNSRGWFFKVNVQTYWIKHRFDNECGYYDVAIYKNKSFSYPEGAIGKTVFLSKKQAEKALESEVKE